MNKKSHYRETQQGAFDVLQKSTMSQIKYAKTATIGSSQHLQPPLRHASPHWEDSIVSVLANQNYIVVDVCHPAMMMCVTAKFIYTVICIFQTKLCDCGDML